jgi:hypothetical protein
MLERRRGLLQRSESGESSGFVETVTAPLTFGEHDATMAGACAARAPPQAGGQATHRQPPR